MTDRCKFVSTTEPRVLPGRHHDECGDEACGGCQPCPMDHCRVCGVVHASGACPGCLAETRGGFGEIRRMCHDLATEVEHRGVEGEAMVLLGPTADPEAWGHREASARAGRVPGDYLEVARDEAHPLWVAATWAMVYRDAFEHAEPSGPVSLTVELDYLDEHLTEAGDYEHVPFEDLARDVRRCVSHLEAVLHDGEQIDEGVPCLKCRQRLRRVWGYGAKQDGWECRRCHEFSTEDQYRFAVKADYIRSAAWLTDVDMAVRVPTVTSSTVRSWASEKADRPVLIRKTLHSERVVYSVEDVQWIDACRKQQTRAA